MPLSADNHKYICTHTHTRILKYTHTQHNFALTCVNHSHIPFWLFRFVLFFCRNRWRQWRRRRFCRRRLHNCGCCCKPADSTDFLLCSLIILNLFVKLHMKDFIWSFYLPFHLTILVPTNTPYQTWNLYTDVSLSCVVHNLSALLSQRNILLTFFFSHLSSIQYALAIPWKCLKCGVNISFFLRFSYLFLFLFDKAHWLTTHYGETK